MPSFSFPNGHAAHLMPRKGRALRSWRLVWAPTGQTIAEGVRARTARAAVRQAPSPHRRYLGEIYATQE
jgi:hypothetical protein